MCEPNPFQHESSERRLPIAGPPRVTVLRGMLAALLVAASCVYDANDRCGERQVYNDSLRNCICAPGYILAGSVCVACGVNEVAGPAGCTCADGFVRPSDGAACAPKPIGQGDACNTDTAPCASSVHNYCAVTSGTSGYCTTKGCAGTSDCTSGYACHLNANPSFCQRPPVGAGRACTGSADCAGTEATYCDAYMSHVCMVQGCTLNPNSCFAGTQCCDLKSFGVPEPVCVPEGNCPQ